MFDPSDQGHSPDLPAIAVEDTTCSPGNLTPGQEKEDEAMIEEGGSESKKILAHTARPPVELME